MTSRNGVEGGCLCGSVRFAVSEALAPAACCHCSDCRKTTGSAFDISIPVSLGSSTVLSGSPRGFTKAGDSGTKLTRHFRPDCGSPPYTSSGRHPDRVYVKAGSLNDPSRVMPAYQSWTGSRVLWAEIPPGLPGYAKGRPAQGWPRGAVPPFADASRARGLRRPQRVDSNFGPTPAGFPYGDHRTRGSVRWLAVSSCLAR